jgi:hypothetical protein
MKSWGARRQSRTFITLAAIGLLIAASPGAAHARRWKRHHPKAAPAAAPEASFDADAAKSSVDRPKDERSCAAAYQSAQEREQAGHLREAKELLQTCAKSTCGSFLRHACTTRFAQVDSDIPSVIPVVTDEGGAPHVDVEVRVDGEVVTSQLDGHALPVDPGLHEFTFANGGKVFATQKIMVVQGQRNRPVSAALRTGRRAAPPRPAVNKVDVATAEKATGTKAAPEHEAAGVAAVATEEASAPEATSGKKGPSVATWVLGGAGVAAIGAGATMILWGRKDNTALSNCTPWCSTQSLDHVKKMYLLGDISLGVGVAALAASYWVYAATRHSGGEEGPAEQAHLFDVQPTKSGAIATFSGKF